MSKTVLIIIFSLIFAGLFYLTFFSGWGTTETITNAPAQTNNNSDESDEIVTGSPDSFYDNGDDVFCRVGSGAVESIYYFSDGLVRVSGVVNGQEVNAIYKDNAVYTWSVAEGEIVSPLGFTGPNARQDNLLDFGPADYDEACTPWPEVDKSVFELPNVSFEISNN